MARWVQANRKAKRIEVMTLYNCAEPKSVSKYTTHRALRQRSYNSRSPRQVLLLSAKSSNVRLQWAQAQARKSPGDVLNFSLV